MRHVRLMCLKHPDLRWMCKSIAVNGNGSYNGMRNIFYEGHVNGKDHPPECDCPASILRFAPEELELQKTQPLGDE